MQKSLGLNGVLGKVETEVLKILYEFKGSKASGLGR